ncbi:hydrolase [Sinomonas cellulolyticus]|uniref:MBL fold metallo-hydrolase n=1 Tax=Sinomonas cellulolyticus TaxID=2801916 RepID=A0ABS1K5E3_9MICC|nr:MULTISPECIES: MBL fold metallo-hydrolase [Sinomonas]MBL0706889.1 MBL fold metallo-hydrolase [Sinomonas cellulolyticus]GHG53015.1 hydrolase [Sinomonas sp. KCTC 49339]
MDNATTGLEVITLGTAAGPAIRSGAPGIATAVVVDGAHYLIDFGLGCTRQAQAAGLHGKDLRAAFVTHLHSDHVGELPAYLLWNWGAPVQGFERDVPIYGPGPDTSAMVSSILAAYDYDIRIRIVDEGRPDLRKIVRPVDIPLPADAAAGGPAHTPAMEPFMVYEDELVTVTAILVEHPPVFPAFAFRFDTRYGSVVISGDTTECSNVARLARGADLLVHEAVNLSFFAERDFSPEFLNHQQISHTTPPGVGRIATAAGVPHVVLSHLAGVATDDEWADGVRAEFAGKVTVAKPGQRFALSAQPAHT